MKKKKRGLVDWQKVSEINSKQTYNAFIKNEDEEYIEDIRANSDSLAEKSGEDLTTAQILMGDAIEHLQGRQKDVYMMTMRQGMSISEAGKILNISKATAQVYRDRAIKFITAYCRQKLDK